MERIQSPRTDDNAIEAAIVAKGKTAPRVTPAALKAVIASTHFFTAADAVHYNGGGPTVAPDPALSLLTICVLVLRNGFTVTGTSACASPENFDAEIGKNIALQNAENQIWPLEGYLLKQRLYDQTLTAQAPTTCSTSTLPPHQQRVIDERAELNDKMVKLEAFTDTPLFASLDEAERRRLMAQHGAMFAYSTILTERIAAF